MYHGKADLDETPAENLWGSDPGYDEARGPGNPRHFLFGEDRYVPIDEVPRYEDGLIDFAVMSCFAFTGVEDPRDYEDRLFHQDPSEPLGRGETVESVVRDLGPVVIVDDDYEPDCGPAKIAVRNFGVEEFTPVSPGMVAVTVRKFDKATGRVRKMQYVVPVTVHTKQ